MARWGIKPSHTDVTDAEAYDLDFRIGAVCHYCGTALLWLDGWTSTYMQCSQSCPATKNLNTSGVWTCKAAPIHRDPESVPEERRPCDLCAGPSTNGIRKHQETCVRF